MSATSLADMIGETLTIDEAAAASVGLVSWNFRNGMESLWREPRDSFLRSAWDVRCDLLRRLESGGIEPLRTAFLEDGRLDPIGTVIRTQDLISVLRERGEVLPWILLWEQRHPLKTPVKPARQQKDRSEAAAILREKYPDGFPPDKSDNQVYLSLAPPGKGEPGFSIDTMRRAKKALLGEGWGKRSQ